MRLLHTADWQLGMKADFVAEAAETVRNTRLKTVERLLGLAEEREVDLILVCGDLFEDNHVDLGWVRSLIALLRGANAPVYIIPGNHDCFSGDSIYCSRPFREMPENIHVLTEPQPVEFPRLKAVLYPCPLLQKRLLEDPTAWIPDRSDAGVIRVGMAHGSLEGIGGDITDLPISPRVADESGLDYLALGHWHSTFYHREQTAYSGTPEPTGFGEVDSGNALVVDIPGPGASPMIEKIQTCGLNWFDFEEQLYEPVADSLKALAARLDEIENPRKSLVRLRVGGALSADGLERLERFSGEWRDHFLYFELTGDELSADILAGRLSEFAESRPITRGVLADLEAMICSLDRRAPSEPVKERALDPKLLREVEAEAVPDGDREQLGQTEIRMAVTELAKLLSEVERE